MKLIRFAVLLFALASLPSCGTMMILLGDNYRYSLHGQVNGPRVGQGNGLSGVVVRLDCPGIEKGMYQNRKGITDGNGRYQLSGYWPLNGCKGTFEHAEYRPVTITIEKERAREGMVLDYIVDVRLEP